MPLWIKKKVLITVKAYPQSSKKHQETVCTAGICVDTKEWIRLYPVPFRYLGDGQQFKKYDVLELEVTAEGTDGRPESHKIRGDSLTICDSLKPDNNWKRRKEFVLPTLSKSMCEIQREQIATKKSLGAFKLSRPKDFYWNPVDLSKDTDEDSVQLNLFYNQKKELEKLAFDFRYKYTCDGEPDCNGHDQKILDWELGEAFRQWRAKYSSDEETMQKIKEKWLDSMFADDKDPIIFVGNHHFHRQSFMVLGVFYPKREQARDEQLSIFNLGS